MSAKRPVRPHPFLALAVVLIMPAELLLAAAEDATGTDKEKTPAAGERTEAIDEDVTQGALRVVNQDGTVVECPLRHTDVQADVSGFIARVQVTQTFYNPTSERIEAVYVFPLPNEAAVDDMTMVVGQRKIVGLIKRRAQARQIYQQALAAGQTAALLEQERPNIFTQSVGNIGPGQEVRIEISYVDVLKYDMGTYEFHFPMVVGPRFIPGAPVAPPQSTPPELQGKVSPPVPDTDRVPDAARITPPVLKPGYRNGHDISLSVGLEAGVPIRGLEVPNHKAEISRQEENRAQVILSPADAIPNKDFVLRYHVVGKKPEMAVLAHTGQYTDTRRLGRGYFMLMIQPQEDEKLNKHPPREIVFLLDVSGSMSGHPTEKVKESIREMLKLCRPIDTMQVITFASQTHQLFAKPVPISQQTVAKALNFTQSVRGGGGTHMLEGIKRAIDQPIDKKRLRIVIMLSDGYIGNEAEIIQHVGISCGDQIRFWAIGIGSSPNMFLIDGVARQGGGMGKRLGLEENAAGLAEEVIARIQRAQLAKIKIDWGGLEVAETYPAKIPELWAGRPVILFGRYTKGGAAGVHVTGVVEGQPVRWPLEVTLPDDRPAHDVLAKVWARKKIEELMQQTYYMGSPAVEEEVTAMALDYRLMSQYTSFVAVDEKDADQIARQRPVQPPRRILVPVPLPEGTRWEGFFGPLGEQPSALELAKAPALKKARLSARSMLSSRPGMGGMGGMNGMGLRGDYEGYALDYGGYGMGGFGARGAARAISSSGPKPSATQPMRPGAVMFGDQASQITHWRRGSPADPLSYGSYGGYGGAGYGGMAGGYAGRSAPGGAAYGMAEGEEEFGQQLGLDDASFDPYTAGVLAADSQAIAQAANQLLEAGRKHMEKKQYDEARADLIRAYFLATAAANRGNHAALETAGQVLAELESLRAERVRAWKEQLPALGNTLDLVLRDMSLREALEAVGQAAELEIRLVQGSTDDARKMVGGRDVRVTYLDLRGASAAQALDWMLQPLRLTWQPGPGAKAILAASDRRMQRISAWVYDVRTIALPSAEELGNIGNRNQAVAKAKAEADEFTSAVRQALRASEKQVTWFAPGQLLVMGTWQTHRQAASVLAQLASARARPAALLAALHPKTSRRAESRREALQTRNQWNRLIETAEVHEEFGWKLLAAAMNGQLDLKALTELGIAWKSDSTGELLEGKGPAVAMRSAWAVTAASRMLPDEKELAGLARSVREPCRPAAERAMASLEDNAQDLSSILAALYAAMTVDEADLSAEVLAALAASEPPEGSPITGAVLAAHGLLSKPARVNGEQLGKLIATGGIAGQDVTVLVALACRRAGGDTWATFRAEMKELLGKQPLPGSVVVLANRLTGRVPPAMD